MIFYIPADKYTGLHTDSTNYLNFTFPHFASTTSRSTSEILKVVHCFGELNRNRWTKICDIDKFEEK